MSKFQRTKGHSFERWVARQFREAGYPDARRHLEYQDGEANGVDLANTGPWRVQCKRWKQYAPVGAIEEVNKHFAHGYGQRVLITKADKKEPMAVLPFHVFLQLINKKNA